MAAAQAKVDRVTMKPSRLFIYTALIAGLLAAGPVFGQQPAPRDDDEQAGPFLVLMPELLERNLPLVQAIEGRDPLPPGINFDQAIFDVTTFIYFNPSFDYGYYSRAWLHIDQQNLAEAEADLQQAITYVNPEADYMGNLYFMLGNVQADDGRVADAIATYTEGIDRSPDLRLYVSRAFLYVQAERVEEAIDDFDTAIRMAGDNVPPFLYFYRALAYEVQFNIGSPQAAADYYAYLLARQTTTTDGGTLPVAEPQMIALSADEVYTFTFEGSAGERWSFVAQAARPTDTVDPLLVLVGPDGQPLIADDDSGARPDAQGNRRLTAQIFGFTLPADGTYTVVLGDSLLGEGGAILIAGRMEPAAP